MQTIIRNDIKINKKYGKLKLLEIC